MIGAAFPGMFTCQEILDMGARQKSYWLRQADAIRRQYVATVAQAIGLALADKNGREAILEELELSQTKKDSKRMRSEALWDTRFLMKGGRGV